VLTRSVDECCVSGVRDLAKRGCLAAAFVGLAFACGGGEVVPTGVDAGASTGSSSSGAGGGSSGGSGATSSGPSSGTTGSTTEITGACKGCNQTKGF
jgi:hypothetical protein